MQRAARAASLGCLLGGIAAALLALSDFGAHWLWLGNLRDRGLLLAALLGIEVPIGILAGGVLGCAMGATEGLIEGFALRSSARNSMRATDFVRALRATLLLSPGLIAVAHLLFTGGSMSRLPLRSLLQAVAICALLAGTFSAAYLAHRLHSRAIATRKARTAVLLAALLCAFLLAKVNQWVLPNLYGYLHNVLTVATFLLFLFTAWLWLAPDLQRWSRTFGALLLALAVLSLPSTLAQLDGNQNVRVALLHPNMPHSRAVMQVVAPIWIEPAQRRAVAASRRKARLARAARMTLEQQNVGPEIEDAHVLLVTIDALRPDHLGHFGYHRPTSPALDALAAQSVVFERAYAPAPHSSYSLCSMLTSEYLHETLDLGQEPPSATLASALGAAGYHTAAFYSSGIFHTAAERLRIYERGAFGFALYDHMTYQAEELTDRVLKEVDRTLARGEPSSFFWVHYFDVHEPYSSTHFGSTDIERYDGEILSVDRALDRLLVEMRKRLSRDVIVAITADHGEEFREHGGVYHGSTLYDEQVRVPLILNAKGLPARRIVSPVETIDIAPTLLGLVGLDKPESMRGQDLRALSLGGRRTKPAFAAVTHKKMIVAWPHKLIADLRFGLFELYDLERDPKERDNLADRQPELLSKLRSEIYAWLDSLTSSELAPSDPVAAALAWGRLGDRRAVAPLSALVTDNTAAVERRVEAARMLGHLADKRASLSLAQAMQAVGSPLVAAEAAIALGRMYDPHARDALRRLIATEDPELRVRAAVSLGRLRDPLAVPALIEALWIAQGEYERQEAVRWLGRLRDRRALGPLIDLLPELRTRFLVVVAIGLIGDRSAYESLAQVLNWDQHANVRDATLQGLGLLGDPRAIDLIVPLATDDPTLEFASEALVRLGAIESGAIGGVDLSEQTKGLTGFSDCVAGSLLHDWDYLHRTYCQTRPGRSTLTARVPVAVASAPYGTRVVLGIKRSDSAEPTSLRVTLGVHDLGPITIDGGWHEHRFMLPRAALSSDRSKVTLTSAEPRARFAVDHLLLLPRTSEVVAQRQE